MRLARRIGLGLLVAVAGAGLDPPRAEAFAHLWDIDEVYSNADGSVQFVELLSHGGTEVTLSRASLRSATTGQVFRFLTDLSGDTSERRLLVATAGFEALPGAVSPDYVLPARFFDPGGDTLAFRAGYFAPVVWDTFAFGGATPLPVDGLQSLARDHASGGIAAALNSPMNFAGESGTVVPEPTTAWLLATGLALVALRTRRACRRVGAVVSKRAVKNSDLQRLAARRATPVPGGRRRAGQSLVDSRSTMT